MTHVHRTENNSVEWVFNIYLYEDWENQIQVTRLYDAALPASHDSVPKALSLLGFPFWWYCGLNQGLTNAWQ